MGVILWDSNSEELFKGRVVELGERNGYHDSDFYAIVMMGDGSFDTVEYDTTRAATSGRAWVDATPEVWEAYAKWKDKKRAELEAWRQQKREEQDKKDFEQGEGRWAVERGAEVEVFRGRKVPIGTTGVCFYTRRQQWGLRIGIKDDEGNVFWGWGRNARLINPR